MTARVYTGCLTGLLNGSVNLLTGAVKAVLVDTGGYTFSASDQYLSAIPAAARVGTPVALTGRSVAAAALSAASTTFTSVQPGSGSAATIEAIVLFVDTGDPTTSLLVAYDDVGSGLPLTLNGSNVTIAWNSAGVITLS